MEDTETKLCLNCKREIPSVNFTIHNVHCARNIRVCVVCKEPVPHNELQEHHNKLHKLLPCEKCGENVCGTDLEDHIRDSCAHTIKSCRFCELEVPRRDLPAHENYCGVRTEQCPECREWVMIKYRQLHVDSNHGFIRLDDDPNPVRKKELPKTEKPKPVIAKITNIQSLTNGPQPTPSSSTYNPVTVNGYVKNNNQREHTAARLLPGPSSSDISKTSSNGGSSSDWRSTSNGVVPSTKRTNEQPQINTNVTAVNKIDKNISKSRGAVKKRPAPPPPADPRRDLPYYSALQRQQREENQRQEQNAYNLAVGLPPVLTPAAKLDKLRKMDALQNRETEVDYKSKLQGRVWRCPDFDSGNSGYVLGSSDNERRRREFQNLKPMTSEEFMERFSQLQMSGGGEEDRKKSADRFSEIKSSLRELRRGLNEVTAPYNSNAANNSGDRSSNTAKHDEERLPCEFCDTLVSARDLVQHQTGCRPDLAQLRPSPGSKAPSPVTPRVDTQYPPEDPVIPCEFCLESLPVYLITEHQERCGQNRF